MNSKSSKSNASYQKARAEVKKYTRELRNKRKGGKRTQWELMA